MIVSLCEGFGFPVFYYPIQKLGAIDVRGDISGPIDRVQDEGNCCEG